MQERNLTKIKTTVNRVAVLLLIAVFFAGVYCLNVGASYGSKTVFTVFDFEKEKLGSNIWDGPTRTKGEYTYKVVNSSTANNGKGLNGIQGQAIEAHQIIDKVTGLPGVIFGTHLASPIDLSAYANGKYALKIRIYFDKFDPLYNPTGETIAGGDWGVEMTNNGNADTKAYRWGKKGFVPQAGWNEIYLPIRAEYITSSGLGKINLAKVNFIRFWNTTNDAKYCVLDSVTIVDYSADSISVNGNVMSLDHCDDASAYYNGGVDTANKKQGYGSIAEVAWNPNQPAQVSRKWSNPIDTKVTLKTGALKLWIYISDISHVSDLSIELTSSGESDKSEINWSKDTLNLKNGWNEVTLQMKDATAYDGVTEKAFNPAALNYFRIYAIAAKPLKLAVDDIRIVKNDGNYTTPTDNVSANNSANNTVSAAKTSSDAVKSTSEIANGSESFILNSSETENTGSIALTTSDSSSFAENTTNSSDSAAEALEQEKQKSTLPLILLFIGLGILILGGTGTAVYFLVLKKK